MKPIFSKIVALVLLLVAWTSASAFTVDGLNYSTKDGVAYLTGATSKSITSLTVPATVTYGGKTYPVNYLYDDAFDNYKSLRSVRFEESDAPICTMSRSGEMYLPTSPFENCPIEEYYFGRDQAEFLGPNSLSYNLTYLASTADSVKLTYGGKTTGILSKTFLFDVMSATKVTEVTIGGDIKYFHKNDSFADCINLQTFTLNPGDYTVPSSIFPSIVIDNLILNATQFTTIPYKNVKNLTFGEGWESVPDNFMLSSNVSRNPVIESISLPLSISRVGEDAFDYCINLESVNFPNNLVTIEDYAFQNCEKLLGVSFGDHLKRLGRYAFSHCNNINEITLPGSLIEINESFYNCANLKKVTLLESSEEFTLYKSPFFVCPLDSLILERVVPNLYYTEVSYLKLGEGWEEIPKDFKGSSTLNHDKNLEILSLPSTLKSIGDDAFDFCESLKEVNFPENLVYIGNNAFQYCKKLQNVVFGNKLEYIGFYAFAECESLTDLVLPGSLLNIDNSFRYCTGLKRAELLPSTLEFNVFESPFDNCKLDTLVLGRCIPKVNSQTKVSYLVFGEGWEDIPAEFIGTRVATNPYTTLSEVSLPSSLKTIGLYAFGQCTSLIHINFPLNLSKIEEGAFANCKNLKTAVFPEKLQSIGINAFGSCLSLEEVVIPGSVIEIGGSAFQSCNSLKSVTFLSSDLPIEVGTTSLSSQIDSLFLYRVLPSLGYARPSNVVFGEGWEVIPRNTLHEVTNLVSVVLPSTLKKIDEMAFYMSKNIQLITSNATTPPTCGNWVFESSIYPTAVLTVPLGSKRKYAAADVWKNFVNIQTDGELVATVEYDHEQGEVTLNGEAVESVSLDEGEPLDVVITPAVGLAVESVTANGENVTDKLVDDKLHYDEISDNLNLVVEFAPIMYDLTIPESVTGGHIEINGSEEFPSQIQYGSRVAIRAVADEGYLLKSLSINGEDVTVNSDGEYVIENLTEKLSVVPLFEIIRFKIVAEYKSEMGTVTLNGEVGETVVDYGSSLSIAATPNPGYRIGKLGINNRGEVLEEGTPFVIEHVTKDLRISVFFEELYYDVTVNYDNALGSVTVNGSEGSAWVQWGTEAKVVITPEYGYEIAKVELDGEDVTDEVNAIGVLTLKNIKADRELTVTFDEKRVLLSIALEGGVLSTTYEFGTELRYTPVADEGWNFHSATVGRDVITALDEDGGFVVGPLTEDTLVTVVFSDSVNEVSMIGEDKITVTAQNRTVTISGASDEAIAEVFDTAGIRYYRGTDRVINLDKPSVYIVTISGRSYKVMLR